LRQAAALISGLLLEDRIDSLVEPLERLSQQMFRGAKAASRQVPQRNQVVLKVAVVVAVEDELGARDQGDGVEIADVSLTDLRDALRVGGGLLARIHQTLQVLQNSQNDDGDGGQALLTVDDFK